VLASIIAYFKTHKARTLWATLYAVQCGYQSDGNERRQRLKLLILRSKTII